MFDFSLKIEPVNLTIFSSNVNTSFLVLVAVIGADLPCSFARFSFLLSSFSETDENYSLYSLPDSPDQLRDNVNGVANIVKCKQMRIFSTKQTLKWRWQDRIVNLIFRFLLWKKFVLWTDNVGHLCLTRTNWNSIRRVKHTVSTQEYPK